MAFCRVAMPPTLVRRATSSVAPLNLCRGQGRVIMLKTLYPGRSADSSDRTSCKKPKRYLNALVYRLATISRGALSLLVIGRLQKAFLKKGHALIEQSLGPLLHLRVDI